MNAEIIAVGTELLLGQIANTNAQFLSKELAQIGINVFYHTAVGDNTSRLERVIREAQQRSDLIIFTGGLGPTKDDLTKETLAAVLGVGLVYDTAGLNKIQAYFKDTNRQMTENNKKQALVLKGSTVLPNDNGMAPGIAKLHEKKLYILFPGPPSELKPMFEKYARPFLLEQLETKEYIESRVLRFFGIGESQLETEIQDLIDTQKNPTIAPLAGEGEVTLRLTAKEQSTDKVKTMLDRVEHQINKRVGSYFYGYDSTSLYKEAFQKLKEAKLTISSAESLTGGSFAQEITAFDGASQVYQGSIVCYQNEIKENVLNVSREVLETQGAVSAECAKQMAEQVRKIMNSDIGVSFTGVAGPTEQEGKPVGTVYIGISIESKDTEVYALKLAGNRKAIRNRAVKYANFHLLKLLS